MIYRVRAVLVVGAILVALLPLPAEQVERVYSANIYPTFQHWLTALSNTVPFALLDVAVLTALIVFVIRLTREWRSVGRRAALTRAAARIVTIGALVYLLFLLTWGLNYRRVPLERKIDFDAARITPAAARQLATLAIEHVNDEYSAAHASEFRVDALERAFADTQRLLGRSRPATIGRPKRSFASVYFQYAAIDGMTVPIFLEVIVNPGVLPIERPSVLAHEWAHLAGYADESEANFVAWISAVRCADPVAQYSAWLDAYTLAAGALSRNDRASLPPLAEGPRADLRNIAARYSRSSPLIRTAARGVYDSYLKANRVEEGIENYGVVLQLLLGTRFDDAWKPRLAGS
jgi:hypothetical protein